MSDIRDDLKRRAELIRRDMGGAGRVETLRAEGKPTIREHIDGLLDEGSFRELGTFSRSLRVEDRTSTPGDGKIGGEGLVQGRPIAVAGDDITVKRGSSSIVGSRKTSRLYQRALEMGIPYIYFGETGGGRIPDLIGSEGISEALPSPDIAARRRKIPMATIIVGQSFGGSSFQSAFSDYTVQVRGSVLAVTSPRVFEIATGEIIGFEELGGVDVHAKLTGQIDLGVDTYEEAYDSVRRWLSYLPSNAWSVAPRGEAMARGRWDRDESLAALVPEARRRGYDMRKFCAALLDPDSFFELQPKFARNLTTGLGRLDGWPVAVIANNPMFSAGVLNPDACDKAIRMMCLADAFNLPLIWLMDVPGFMVGRKVEHERMLFKAIRMVEALCNLSTPSLSVVLRKGFGLAYQAMNTSGMGAVGFYAWPGAEIGFMDPDVGVNVAYASRLEELDGDDRERERQHLIEEVGEATSPYEAAGTMRIDEVIDPADTRRILAEDLGRLATRKIPRPEDRPLSYWPTC
ncbi:MAG: carboxyl transferase domain-containing protein [Pseudomonadales bacterium]|nr:carboxyl transferase domain-containing protein [Pseudomonadales bacterium]